MKVFEIFDTSEVKVEDPSLRKYINLEAKLIQKGREREKFGRTKINVIERIINLLCVPGHRGKKHKIMTGHASGKFSKNANVVIAALKIVQQKTNSNPIQVLVTALENSAPGDEVTTIEYGGARYPQAVDVSPMRRLNIALRNLVHGAQDKAFGKKKKIHETLAEEIILASQKSSESLAIAKRNESEKQADSAR